MFEKLRKEIGTKSIEYYNREIYKIMKKAHRKGWRFNEIHNFISKEELGTKVAYEQNVVALTMIDKCENIVSELNLKKCCKECEFPLDIKRKPVFLSDNIFSFISYEDNKCKTCGHQKSGWTINSVYNHIQKLRKNWENKQQEKINELKDKINLIFDKFTSGYIPTKKMKFRKNIDDEIDKILGGET